jgi:hypothetical protein
MEGHVEQQAGSLTADSSRPLLDSLRERLTPAQGELLRRLWANSDHLGWVTAKALFYRLPVSDSRNELERLGGSLVTETTGDMDESYALRLLGALVGNRGNEFEALLSKFLAYEANRYDEDMDVKDITRAEVERDLHLGEEDLAAIYRLLTIAVHTLCNGCSGGPNWSVGVMRNIHDLTEVTDWRRFVREHALHDNDPNLPVRARARDKYEAQQRAQKIGISNLPVSSVPASPLMRKTIMAKECCFRGSVRQPPRRQTWSNRSRSRSVTDIRRLRPKSRSGKMRPRRCGSPSFTSPRLESFLVPLCSPCTRHMAARGFAAGKDKRG